MNTSTAFLSKWKDELKHNLMTTMVYIGTLEAQCSEMVARIGFLEHCGDEFVELKNQMVGDLQAKSDQLQQVKTDYRLKEQFQLFKAVNQEI